MTEEHFEHPFHDSKIDLHEAEVREEVKRKSPLRGRTASYVVLDEMGRFPRELLGQSIANQHFSPNYITDQQLLRDANGLTWLAPSETEPVGDHPNNTAYLSLTTDRIYLRYDGQWVPMGLPRPSTLTRTSDGTL